jgi:hypothetical protein
MGSGLRNFGLLSPNLRGLSLEEIASLVVILKTSSIAVEFTGLALLKYGVNYVCRQL